MKKKLIAIIPVFILMMTMCMMTGTASKSVIASIDYGLYGAEHGQRLVDGADFLSDSQEDDLNKKLDEASDKIGMDVVVVTVPDLGSYVSAMNFADDYMDYGGYSNDCVLLLVTDGEAGNRDWWISTKGKGEKIFTEKRLTKVSNKMLPEFKSGNFYEGFVKYADGLVKQKKASNFASPIFLIISPIVGILAGFIYAGALKSQLDSVKMAANANDYIREGSFNLTGQRDTFLYNTVERTHIERSSGSSGGGSHISSSGSSHGGIGGKF